MNKLETLYNEKACKEALREVNIELLERAIKKAPRENYEKEWFLKSIESSVEAIRKTNEELNTIITAIDKQLSKKEF